MRLASSRPAWALRFSDLDHAVDLIEQAFAQAPIGTPLGHRRLADVVAASSARPGALHRSNVAAAWEFGDGSAVVFDPESLKLARLDPVGVAVWEILVEPASASEILAEAPDSDTGRAVERWLETLLAAGLVVRD